MLAWSAQLVQEVQTIVRHCKWRTYKDKEEVANKDKDEAKEVGNVDDDEDEIGLI